MNTPRYDINKVFFDTEFEEVKEKFLDAIKYCKTDHGGKVWDALTSFESTLGGSKDLGNFVTVFNSNACNLLKVLKDKIENQKRIENNAYVENFSSFKMEIKDLHNRILDSHQIGPEDLKNFSNNVIDFLILFEVDDSTKKILEGFKNRNEVKPIPGPIKLGLIKASSFFKDSIRKLLRM